MPQELIYTSVPKGLKPGSSGFSTVLHTTGMAPNLITRLENLSGYTYLFPPDSAEAVRNPVVYSHYTLNLAGKEFHVISRNAPYGMDYTGRSNNLAHHMVFQSNELPSCGPGILLQKSMVTVFQEPQRVCEFAREIHYSSQPDQCKTWASLTGDAGWAARLAQTVQTRQIAVILFRPGTDMMPLLSEALLLLPEQDRWKVTFSTCFRTLQAGLTCQWRFMPLLPNERPNIPQNALVLDLTYAMGPAPDGPFVELAKTGKEEKAAYSSREVGSSPKPAGRPVTSPTRRKLAETARATVPEVDFGPAGPHSVNDPMSIPSTGFDDQRVYQPKKKSRVKLVLAVLGLCVLAVGAVAGGIYWASLQTPVPDAKNFEQESVEAEKESVPQKTVVASRDKESVKAPLKDELNELAGNDAPNVPEEAKRKRSVTLEEAENSVREETLDESLTWKFDKEVNIQVVPQDGNEGDPIPETEEGFAFKGETVLTFENHRELKFEDCDQLDEFLATYKIVATLRYQLEIDGTLMDFSKISGEHPIEVGDLTQYELAGSDDFRFQSDGLSVIQTANEKVLLKGVGGKDRKIAFMPGDDFSKDLLQELCDQCRFEKNEELLRVPVIAADGTLLALLENSATGSAKKAKFEYSIPENLKDLPEVRKNGNPVSDKEEKALEFNFKKHQISLRAKPEFFANVEIHFVEGKAVPEPEKEAQGPVLTSEAIDRPDFWYNPEEMPWLPIFRNIKDAGSLHLSENKEEFQDSNKNNDPVFVLDRNGDKTAFRFVRPKEPKTELPRKLTVIFEDETSHIIFFTSPQYGLKKLQLAEGKTEGRRGWKLKLKGKPGPVTTKVEVPNPKSKDENDKKKTEETTFTISIEGTTVTFKSGKPDLTITAEAKILKEGQPVLEVQKYEGKWVEKKIPPELAAVEFGWDIFEDGHRRWTSDKEGK